jgi:ATP-binding cassette subfamily F protein 3
MRVREREVSATLISLKNIQKSFGALTVLANVTFMLDQREKAAVTGVNGAGKTTLFRILTGEYAPDDGVFSKPSDLVVGYLPQEAELNSENSISDELNSVLSHLDRMEKGLRDLERSMANLSGDELDEAMNRYDELTAAFERQNGYERKSRLRGVLKGLGFEENEWSFGISQLSGGQKTRVALGKLLLSQPDLLLLDEPTNHLDIESVTWLEDYLKGYPGAVIIISHDRYFLDRTVTKIVELENGVSYVYNGNYTFYAKYKAINRETALKRYLDQQKEIKRQENIIARLRSYNREKSVRAAENKEKRLDMMEKVEKPLNLPEHMRLLLTPRHESGNDVLDVIDCAKYFDGEPLFTNANFSLKKGDRAALTGANGVGKTTLLKIILGENDGHSSGRVAGRVIKGANVRTGYYDQEHARLDYSKTIFEEISDVFPRLTNGEIRNMLAAFMFTGDEVFKTIRVLSGGEKGRVILAKIMLGGANFLILDEPTNHLDMASKDILEEALRNYSGTVLYVSHDRYFINNTATRVFEMTRNGIRQYLGNYDSYMEKKREAQAQEIDPERELVYFNRRSDQDLRKRKNEIARTMREIDEREKQIAELDILLSDNSVGANHELASKYYDEKIATEESLLSLYEKYEKLTRGN